MDQGAINQDLTSRVTELERTKLTIPDIQKSINSTQNVIGNISAIFLQLRRLEDRVSVLEKTKEK